MDDVPLSDRNIVDLNLTDIRRQLKFHFLMPKSRFSQWESKSQESGVVDSEATRDDTTAYRDAARSRKTEKWTKRKKLEFKSDSSDYEEPESMVFARNMTWEADH
ncbi:hypothetical protein OH492_26775 [Vibrio chagasii]|nr:hypothetical protein [Vibrio chagasii]